MFVLSGRAFTAPGQSAPYGDGDWVVKVALMVSKEKQLAFKLTQRGVWRPEPAPTFGIRTADGRTFVRSPAESLTAKMFARLRA